MRATGTVSLHPKGFGFLNFEEGSAFIAPPALNPFLVGDQVSASLKKDEQGRFSAHDLSLERRARRWLFGQATRRRGRLWLQVDREVANTDWPLQGDCREGDHLLCLVDGDQAVVEQLVSEDIPLERLIARFDLEQHFTKAAESQVGEILSRKHEPGSRKDLRKVPTVTIDAPSTRDLDDAVSVLEADSEGAIRLLVSIADPAEFISRDSPLDQEARRRGTSTYLADRVLPMLPHQLSNQHLSLLPGTDRCCLTAELRIDPEGDVLSVDVYESLIRSDTRLSYEELSAWLDLGEFTEALEKVEDMLPWLRTAAARISVARSRRGGINMSGEVAQVEFDAGGAVQGTSPTRTTSSHLLVERFMVAANEAVARWMHDRGLATVYRIHPEPDFEQVKVLTDCARQFGYEPAFGKRLSPGALAAFDTQIVGDAAEPAIRSVLRGILGAASYTVHPAPHLGLGAPLYLHFTSPLRRYADFEVHRRIKDYLHGERPHDVEDPEVERLSAGLNQKARNASQAESLRRRMLLAEYMSRHLGETFKAHITRVLPFGLVAQLKSSLVEGLIPLESLPGGPWETTAIAAVCGQNRFDLGMPVLVKVVHAEPEHGRLEYALEGPSEGA